jgi:hypothetical protein
MPTIVSPPIAADVVERDDGRYAICLDGPGFESGPFAMAAAERLRLRSTRHDPERCRP